MENMAERLITRAKQLTTRRLSTHRLLQLSQLRDECERRCQRKAATAVWAKSMDDHEAAAHFLEQAARYLRMVRRCRKRLEQESGL